MYMRNNYITPSFRPFMKNSFIAGLTLLLGCVNQYQCSALKQYDTPEAKMELAQCLLREATFFSAYWCPACFKQEKVFGSEAWNIFKKNYVECSERSSPEELRICIKEELETIPFWKFENGKQINGYQTLEQLAKLSGCDNY